MYLVVTKQGRAAPPFTEEGRRPFFREEWKLSEAKELS